MSGLLKRALYEDEPPSIILATPSSSFDSSYEWINVSPDVKKLADFNRTFTGYIVSHTRMFRSIGLEHLTSSHVVIEIGSSYGVASNLMAKKAKMVVGVETSKECIEKARKDFAQVTNLRFELMDILLMPKQAAEIVKYSLTNKPADDLIVFLDIGGDRDVTSLLSTIAFIERSLTPRIIVVKSLKLCRTHPRVKNQPTVDIYSTEEKENVCSVRHFVHPLKYPEKLSLRSGRMICRYENYDLKGCFKHRDPFNLGGGTCELDHEECHACGELGHRARECKHEESRRLR
ncbi:hypothetical protein TrCOL_g9833 [Triparma columacea]|uniref:CCHC-type domain-containing protein n=1 Tax=Triparma columacea TaxID=722753 RepID=A0A9W7GJX0_9STRA|nr:hypothetical protein TrCOL_g9833 [Triparma columacea]